MKDLFKFTFAVWLYCMIMWGCFAMIDSGIIVLQVIGGSIAFFLWVLLIGFISGIDQW